MIAITIPANHSSMKLLLTQIRKVSRSTIVTPQRYYVSLITALLRYVSLEICQCDFALWPRCARSLKQWTKGRGHGCPLAWRPFVPELCYYHQAVARSASVAGAASAASTATPGVRNKERTSSDGLMYGGLKFPTAAPSDRRWEM
jgi:hypothetical protein